MSSYEALILKRNAVIEASAGTGKTYALVDIVTRYIFETDVKLPRILMVTFTKKAAGEISQRVRERLRKVIANPTSLDQKNRAEEAYRAFDDARVYTIHSFCQHTLKRYPLESARSLRLTVSNSAELYEETARDYLREEESRIQSDLRMKEAFFAFRSSFKTFDEMIYGKARDYINGLVYYAQKAVDREHIAILPDVAAFDDLWEEAERFARSEGEIWSAYHAVTSILHDDLSVVQPILRNKVHAFEEAASSLRALIEALSAVALGKGRKSPGSFAQAMTHLMEVTKRYREGSPGAYIAALRAYFLRDFMKHAAKIAEQKRVGSGRTSFDDMLFDLETALSRPESGERLAAKIRAEYDCALIDEFQDTDMRQWRIFYKIFNAPRKNFILIGDKKQSIYRFRGGGYETFDAAKESDPQIATYRLNTNYRSTRAVVDAVNAMSKRVFSTESASGLQYFDCDVPADGGATLFLESGNVGAGAVFLSSESTGALSVPNARKRCYELFAQKIRAILEDPEAVVMKTDRETKRTVSRRIEPGDIACLFSAGTHGEEFKRILRREGIPCSIYKQKGGVLNSDEGLALTDFLKALALRGNSGIFQKVLAGPIFGFGLTRWVAMEESGESAKYYADLAAWRGRAEEGRLAHALDAALNATGYIARILQDGEQGERRYVNARHVVDLILRESRHGERTLAELYRVIQEKAGDSDDDDEEDEKRLRIESDGKAVQIITIHSSKGLEFPVVFCGYGLSGEHNPNYKFPLNHSYGGERIIDFGHSTDVKRREESANAAEAKRAFYVAVTRAKSRVYIPFLPPKQRPCECFRRYRDLAGPSYESVGWDIVMAGLKSFIDEHEPAIALETLSDDWVEERRLRYMPSELNVDTTLAPMPLPPASRAKTPVMSSYSSIIRGGTSAPEEADRVDEIYEPAFTDESIDATTPLNVAGGVDYGNGLHTFLEKFNFARTNVSLSDFMRDETIDKDLRDAALRHMSFWRAAHNLPPLKESVWQALNTPIPALAGAPLRSVDLKKCRREAEFLIEVREPFLAPVGGGAVRVESGYICGSIDMTFEHDGKLYILDWKTTRLGNSYADYAALGLTAGMKEHKYELQYRLYLYAMEKYARILNPDFSYERDMGGAIYCFVRGMRGSDHSGTGVFFDKPTLAERDAFAKACAKACDVRL